MAECYLTEPENRKDRAATKVWTADDLFPRANPFSSPTDAMFPHNVVDNIHQLKAQKNLLRSADLLNQHLESLQMNDDYNQRYLTDDQRRSMKIRERMLKRKMQKERQH